MKVGSAPGARPGRGESAAQRLVAAMKEQGRVRPIYQTMLGYEIQLRGSV